MDQQSSLDRFLKNRATAILGMDLGKTWTTRPLVAGSLMGVAGLAMLITGLVTREPGMMGSSVGLVFGGGVSSLMALWHRRHWRQQPATEAEMSREARDLMIELTRKTIGWNPIFDKAGFRLRRRRMRLLMHLKYGSHETAIEGSAKNLLNDKAFELLESACYQYNRIYGVLEASDDPGVQKMTKPVKLAADETLFSLFEDAAVIQRYPEGGVSDACRQKVESLRELAERMEGLQKMPLQAQGEGAAKIDSVLEELRLEQLARTELKQVQDGEQELEQGT